MTSELLGLKAVMSITLKSAMLYENMALHCTSSCL